MKIVDTFPNAVRELPHVEVPMPDGARLAARIWMPDGAEGRPVPAILEYLPYRKNDFTAERDATMQPYLAGHGYAVVRLDLRGAGDSEGVMPDEYLPQELEDGVAAIEWIAAQPWCDGNVGMIGISWGGFNGLQVAALRPPALKAIVTLCSTDDRYADDVHYMGGCLLGEQLSWASIMFGRNSLPPDPANVGERWRDMWMERLNGSGLWLKNWLEHQTRDAFWKHGSVCEDWSAIRIPVYAVSGWPDGYCRAVFRLMENLQGPRKGLVGPWAHRYPHMGEPGPAIGFLQEELRWWDHWLKGRDTGIMDEPMLRLYRMNSAEPAGHYEYREGEWIAEPCWPSPNVRQAEYFLAADHSLAPKDGRPKDGRPQGVCAHSSPPDVGMASGKWCGYSTPGDAPLDKRRDDAGSLTFETAPLGEALDIAGDAQVVLDLEVDRPVAQLAVRISDVHRDGRSTRVTFGVLNLTHRDGHEHPKPLEPGRRYTIRVPMKHVAQRFRPGHRVRLAISTNYFPMIWPAPERATIRLHTEASRLILPVRGPVPEDDTLAPFGAPEGAPPFPREVLEEPKEYWEIVENARTGGMEMRLADGAGRVHFPDNDLTTYAQGTKSYRIEPRDATSATGRTRWRYEMARGDWRIATETETILTADDTDFLVRARLRAWEGETLVHEQEWDERIARNLV